MILHRAVHPAGSSRAQPDLELKNKNSFVRCSGDAKPCLSRVMDAPILLRERVPCARCALYPFPRPSAQTAPSWRTTFFKLDSLLWALRCFGQNMDLRMCPLFSTVNVTLNFSYKILNCTRVGSFRYRCLVRPQLVCARKCGFGTSLPVPNPPEIIKRVQALFGSGCICCKVSHCDLRSYRPGSA